MTHPYFQPFLIASLVVILPCSVMAQRQTQDGQLQPIWGAASNGVCAGIGVKPSDWPTHTNDYYCDISVRDMSTNRLYVWLPPLEQRYEIELWGPDGRRINQLKSLSLSQRHPLGLTPFSKEGASLDWCLLKETFDLRTNGLHTLIVSVRVNVFTNTDFGDSHMRRQPVYFFLPPVTNAFNVAP